MCTWYTVFRKVKFRKMLLVVYLDPSPTPTRQWPQEASFLVHFLDNSSYKCNKTNTFNDSRKEKQRNQLCGVKYLDSGESGHAADRGTPPVPVFVQVFLLLTLKL